MAVGSGFEGVQNKPPPVATFKRCCDQWERISTTIHMDSLICWSNWQRYWRPWSTCQKNSQAANSCLLWRNLMWHCFVMSQTTTSCSSKGRSNVVAGFVSHSAICGWSIRTRNCFNGQSEWNLDLFDRAISREERERWDRQWPWHRSWTANRKMMNLWMRLSFVSKNWKCNATIATATGSFPI